MSNNKNFKQIVTDVMTFAKEKGNSLSKLEATILVVKTLSVVNKVSKGLMTETKALELIRCNAKLAVICECVSIASSLILYVIEKYEENKAKETEEDDQVEDFDAEIPDDAAPEGV